MTQVHLDPAQEWRSDGQVDADGIVRSTLFIGMMLLVWVSLHPFMDRSVPMSDITDAGDMANQIAFSSAFFLFVGWLCYGGLNRLKPLLRPVTVLTLLWFALTVVTSWEPALSARRLISALMILTIAGVAVLLPRNVRHFAELLAASVLIVLAISYLGLLLLPALAIHQLSDFFEPEHVGNWRGVFAHKNEAGAAMVIFIFVGLFVARARSLALGCLIVVASTVFLLFTVSKTSLLLLPLILLVSALVVRARGLAIALLLGLGPLVLFNLFSVGSVYFSGVGDIVNQILPDPSFTGRTSIWQFALNSLAARPVTGYGYAAFWGTPQVVYGLSQPGVWAAEAAHAHNAYLNLAVAIGIPGLLLVLAWVGVLPVVDFLRQAGKSARPLAGALLPARLAFRPLLLVLRKHAVHAGQQDLVHLHDRGLRTQISLRHSPGALIRSASGAAPRPSARKRSASSSR